jgi:predicted nucleotide-binding protein (sugar kinase/HSP70/actin superfamily)
LINIIISCTHSFPNYSAYEFFLKSNDVKFNQLKNFFKRMAIGILFAAKASGFGNAIKVEALDAI